MGRFYNINRNGLNLDIIRVRVIFLNLIYIYLLVLIEWWLINFILFNKYFLLLSFFKEKF